MNIGLFLATVNPVATPLYIATFARIAEERGFDSLWVGEHVVLLDDYASKYPYSPDGKLIGLAEDSGMIEPFLALTYAAAHTKTLRLGTGICIVPQRNPVYTAKEVATLDWLSGGRFTLGVGVGWLEEEFRAVDAPFDKRGARCRDYLAVMRALWCDEVSAYKGDYYELPPVRQNPKPLQSPHPPIVFGGESNAALRRVAELGDGWFGFNHTVSSAAECIGRLRPMLEAQGRGLEDLEITASPYLQPSSPEDLPGFADAGVDRVVLLAMAPTVDSIEGVLDEAAERYLTKAATL